MAVDLRRVNRRVRRKLGVGLLKVLGPANLAREVKEVWLDKRSPEWVKKYEEGIQNPDWVTGEQNLELWYSILENEVAPKLRDTVANIYEQAKRKYRRLKEQQVTKAEVKPVLERVVEVVVP